MPSQLTIRVDDDIAEEIDRLARQQGLSRNQTVRRLLKRAAGGETPVPDTADRVGTSLDWFIGSWTAEQAEELDDALRDLGRVDEELWR